MKRNGKRLICMLFALCLCLVPIAALAAETDGVGNMLATESEGNGQNVARDLYSFGQNVSVGGTTVGESALLAGYSVGVNGTSVGGSLRAAGYDVSVGNTVIANNATLAGYSVSFSGASEAQGLYIAANTVNVSGTASTLYAAANQVVVSGTINGDARIFSDNVTVTDGATILGTLYVSGTNEPIVGANASVGSVSFQKSETEAAAATVSTVAPIVSKLKKLIMMLPGRMLLALLYFFIIGKTLTDAANMVKTRKVAMPLSGFVTLIAAPIAAIILLCTYIGVPAGMLVLCLYGLALAFAISFAGAVFGQLVFPKLHGLLASVIGAAIFSVACVVPVLGGIVTFAAMVYTLGYFIQKIYLGFPRKKTPIAAAPIAVTLPAQDAPEAAAPAGSELPPQDRPDTL